VRKRGGVKRSVFRSTLSDHIIVGSRHRLDSKVYSPSPLCLTCSTRANIVLKNIILTSNSPTPPRSARAFLYHHLATRLNTTTLLGHHIYQHGQINLVLRCILPALHSCRRSICHSGRDPRIPDNPPIQNLVLPSCIYRWLIGSRRVYI
jgi:hypothetical protein